MSNSAEKRIGEWMGRPLAGAKNFKGVDFESVTPLAMRLARSEGRPALLVVPNLAFAEELHGHFQKWAETFQPDARLLMIPEPSQDKRLVSSVDAERSSAIDRFLSTRQDFVVCGTKAFLSRVPRPEDVAKNKFTLKKGEGPGFSALLERLVELDYDDEFEVAVPGEFSRRGGIVDIFSPAHDFPARVEFFGDDIDSIRSFDPATQLSLAEIGEYTVIAGNELFGDNDSCRLLDYLREKPEFLTVVVHPEQCAKHLERFGDEEENRVWAEFAANRDGVARMLDEVEAAAEPGAAPCECHSAVEHLKNSLPEEASDLGGELARQITARQISQWVDTGRETTIFAESDRTVQNISEWLDRYSVGKGRVSVSVADLPGGLIFPGDNFVFLVESELFSLKSVRRRLSSPLPRRASDADKKLAELADLAEGDHVVHVNFGVGIFRGITEEKTGGGVEEVITLEYDGDTLVHVPLWQANLISRYIGSSKKAVALSKPGGVKWKNAKAEVTRAVRDLALEMLRMQAIRSSAEGVSFPGDDMTQRIFEESFPFEDTPDQRDAAEEIKKDMTSSKPMDRLLCGDVGFGKTEVAMRAAFKAALSGRQVAVLTPTTILAQQHYFSFTERFAEYPIIIDTISRFRSRAEQRSVLERLAQKKVDIVIGTHRLLQGDVEFADLGLVIIDEEQRFGVEQKEKFKRLRSTVDVLTMTATPIPRTLYMAVTGVRDLSSIITPPNARLPVQTIVAQYDDNIVATAIERELQRGGQVYYLHNRVKTIDGVRESLQKLLPSARIGVAHGQMDEDELEGVMVSFIGGKLDVLVCTTIIESGLDIPNANTMIIERCDRFGLAELYQLRGRIGRWVRQAYAYLLLPKNEVLAGDARKRISAIRKYTHLGAGLKLALRDLEIRGAGNLLGAEQSGYINSVGFDLYCKLLKAAVGQLKNGNVDFFPEVAIALDFVHFGHIAPRNKTAAGIPPEYMPSERLRMDAYRRFSALTSQEEVDEFESELRDRYGAPPECALNLLRVARIKILAAKNRFHSVAVRDGKILLEDERGIFKKNGTIPSTNTKATPCERLEQLLKMLSELRWECGLKKLS